VEVGHRRPRLLRCVIGGSVHHQNRRLPPVLVLGVQHLHQLRQVELHRLGVRVGLQEADVDLAVVVEGRDHRDPRPDLPPCFGELIVLLLPEAPPEIGLSDPGLVDDDQPRLLLQLHQELQGGSLPQDQTPLGVGLGRDLHYLGVAHVQLLLHDRLRLFVGDGLARHISEFFGQKSDRQDLVPVIVELSRKALKF